MWKFIGVLSLLASLVLAAYAFISLIRKNGRAKKALLSSLAAFVLFFVAAINDPSEPTNTESNNTNEHSKQSAEVKTVSNDEQKVKPEQSVATSVPSTPARISAPVLSVTDGDTFKIQLNGKEETVRRLRSLRLIS